MEAINPELHDLQEKVENLRVELARTQGEIEQLKINTKDSSRQTIWQFVAFTVTMAIILIGGIKYQADTLRSEMGLRFDAQRQEISTRLESMEKRIDQSEKNILARFEDLKQEVRASRK